jgi:hypothetical protein
MVSGSHEDREFLSPFSRKKVGVDVPWPFSPAVSFLLSPFEFWNLHSLVSVGSGGLDL